MMIELYKQFSRSIAWNALESVSYQLLLLGHQIMLFKITHTPLYGFIGALFSVTYLVVTLTNFGLDISLSPFITIINKSKRTFKRILFKQLLIEYALLLFLVCLAFIGKSVLSNFSWAKVLNLDMSMVFLLIALIFFEGAKKTLRMILQLAFLNNKTAVIEIITIVSYVSIVWIGYFSGFEISLGLVFIPMVVLSALSSCFLLYYVMRYYQQLPDHDVQLHHSLDKRILSSRFFNFLNQVSHMAFSSNFLVPFFAMLFGLEQAGILKLISAVSHCITTIIQKVFGISSAQLLSHLKDNQLTDKQEAFWQITSQLNQVLYGIIIFLAINIGTLLKLTAWSGNHVTVTLAYLFLIISFSENFFIAYEKFYIAEEKANYLFSFNIIVMSLMSFIIWQSVNFYSTSILLAIIIVRIFAFSCISIISFYHWKIRPALKVEPEYVLWSFVIAFAFYVFMQ